MRLGNTSDLTTPLPSWITTRRPAATRWMRRTSRSTWSTGGNAGSGQVGPRSDLATTRQAPSSPCSRDLFGTDRRPISAPWTSRALSPAFPVQSLAGFMNRLPFSLLGSLRTRIRFQRMVARLALQLCVTHPPARGNPALIQRLPHRAPGLLLMPAIAKTALRGQRRDVGKSQIQRCLVGQSSQFPHPRRVYQPRPTRHSHQHSGRRRVPSPGVVLANFVGGQGAPNERVRNGGLSSTGRTQ